MRSLKSELLWFPYVIRPSRTLASLTILAVLATAFAPFTTFAVQPVDVYSLTVSEPVPVTGTIATMSGIGFADASGANENTTHIAIDWNEDRGLTADPEAAQILLVPSEMQITASSTGGFDVVWGPIAHDYAGAGAGTYTAYAFIYHGQTPGADGFQSSGQIDITDVVIPPQCDNDVNDDGAEDALIDFPADPGCTSLLDDSESPNPITTGTLHLVKSLTNDNGGTMVNSDFSFQINGDPATAFEADGQNDFTLTAGTYSITEVASPGYATSYTTCSNINLVAGGEATCTITNDDIAPTLTLVKVLPNDDGGTATQSEFSVSINNSLSSWGLNTLAAGLKTVSEVTLSGYTPSGWSGDCATDGTITLLPGDTKTCSITNDDQPGTLIVKKVVVNDDGGLLSEDDFSFTINAGAPVPFEADGQNDLTVDAGNYVVTESPTPGYSTSYDNCNVTIANGESSTCTITNDDQSAHLILMKHLPNDSGGDASQDDFTPSINNDSAVWGDNIVDAGTHTVSETTLPGYTSSGWFNACATNGVVTLLPGETKTCEITNDDVPAHLIVIKDVINDSGGLAVDSDFTTTITGVTTVTPSAAGTESPGIDNIITTFGPYSVDEGAHVGYNKTLSADCSGSIALGDVKTCTITNDDIQSYIIVDKIVVNNNGGSAEPDEFLLTVNGGAALDGVAVAVNPGNYTVDETNLPGYNAGVWGEDCASDGTVTVALGETKTCTITNDDNVPSLTLDKVVDGSDGGTASESDWTLIADGGVAGTLNGLGADGSADVESDDSFKAGTYELSEIGPSGYAPSAWSCVKNGGDPVEGNSITLALGDVATCTIVNDDIAPTLTLVKTVITLDGGTATEADFQGKIDGNDVDWETPITLSVGDHTASEDANVSGYSASAWGGDCAEDGSITLSPGQDATCTITNDDIAPGLTLHKVVATDNGGTATESDFQGYIDNAPVAWGDAQTLLAGIYTLSEDGLFGYTPSSWSCEGGSLSDNVITIGLDETVDCTIVNDDIAPTITLHKVVTVDNGGTAGVDDFGLSIGGTPVVSGETLSVNANKAISIDEIGLSGYSFVSITGDEGCPSELGDTVMLSEGENLTCTITNDDIAPSLTLIKQVNNGEEGDANPSDWMLSADGPTPISGEGDVSSDDSFVAGTYTLSEDAGPGHYAAGNWSCVTNQGLPIEGSTVDIAIGDMVTCTITNTFTPFSSDVSLTKTVDDSTPDAGQTIIYTLTVSNAGPDDATGVVVSDTLPLGVTYISDDGSDAYSNGQWTVGTITSGGSATLHITATINGDTGGQTIDNSASAINDNADPNPDNNSTSAVLTVNTPPAPPSGGGGGGNSSGSCSAGFTFNPTTLKCEPRGQVLGASTGPVGEVLGESCGLYMNQHLMMGSPKNNPVQVTKLQEFLNKYKYGVFAPTGFFGPLTFAAVKAFQSAHASDILIPWNISAPTGIVYLTTTRKLNLIECPALMATLIMPELIPWNLNPNAQ